MSESTKTWKARVRVTLTIDVDVNCTWGSSDSVGYIHQQASEEAARMIGNGLAVQGSSGQYRDHAVGKMVTTPEITDIFIEPIKVMR